MASTTGTLDATGSVTLTKSPNETMAQFQISGTYGTVTFVFEGSIDGTNYFAVAAVLGSTGAVVTSTVSPSDNTIVLYNIPAAGLSNVRLRVTAIASGALAVAAQSESFVGLPTLGTQFSGALAGATTLSGDLTLSDVNIVLGTTTGTKIGTATSQKLGFFNATPIVQPANSVDYVTMLVNLGLRASGGTASATFPGALSCAALTATSVAGTGTVALTDNMTITDAKNIILNSTTGSSFGTATTQKLSLYGKTPVVQPAANTDTTTGAAGSGTAVYLNTTFNGGGTAAYTIGGIVAALKAVGILAV